ncbi:MAG: class I SAM-dependent methyltransferase [Cyclobacteriaceae bacterium]|nr:class I SAM-dependent methyltransferase [Cyclobacteriaceae bacterium]
MSKDLFSGHADLYASFRPTYPNDLFQFIFKNVGQFDKAWDCGTGNGQVAQSLAPHFKSVEATDISRKQLENAKVIENINYQVCSAESTPFSKNSFDLISVGQAIHWFDLNKFYSECQRVAKPGCVIALFGYSPMRMSMEFDKLVDDFYFNVIYDYWETERRIVEDQYQSLPLPFELIKSPAFKIEQNLTIQAVEGYFNTWSSVQKFVKERGFNPVPQLMSEIKLLWKEEVQSVYFPVFSKIGRIP